MANTGNQDICNSVEYRSSYRSRNTNYIGGDATVASAIQIAGNHHGDLDLRDVPDTTTAQTTSRTGAQQTHQDDATRQQAVELLWHLARIDPDKRAEAIAVVEALEAASTSV